MNKEFILKKRIIGGFNRRQVINCLAELQTKCNESDIHGDIIDLEEQIKKMLISISDRDAELAELKSRLEELNSLSASCNKSSDSFSSLAKADKVIDSAKNEAEQYIRTTDEFIKNSNKEFEHLMNKISKLNSEISKMGTDATRISDSLNKITIEELSDQAENESDHAEAKKDTPYISDNPNSASTDEEDISYEDENADIFLSSFETQDSEEAELSYNSIDNFFDELDKLTSVSEN